MIRSLGVRHIGVTLAASAGAAVLVCCGRPRSRKSRLCRRPPRTFRRGSAVRWRRARARTWKPPISASTRACSSRPRRPRSIREALRARPAHRSRPAPESRDTRGVGGGPSGRDRRRSRRKRILPGARDRGPRRLQERRGAHPRRIRSDGFFRVDLEQAVPALNLRWLLLDFGRRGSAHWTRPRNACWPRTSASTASTRRSSSAVQRAFSA